MNIKDIERLIRILQTSDITELSVEEEGVKIQIKRDPGVTEGVVVQRAERAQESQNTVEKKEEKKNENLIHVNSKMPGTFYGSPSPTSPPFVKAGDIINESTVICIIEAMKIFNEIKAGVKGRIVKVLVNNGEGIEYNQPLFEVEKL